MEIFINMNVPLYMVGAAILDHPIFRYKGCQHEFGIRERHSVKE
jgi:hypothetical protein